MSANRTLDCPACEVTMDQRVEHGVTIDYCPDCGGVWLDPGELEQLTHRDSHSHHSDIDIDIEDEEEEVEEEEEGGILGTIAGALGGDDEEFEEEGFEEEGFEEEFGGEDEFGGEEEF